MQYYKIEFTINLDGTISEKVIASGSNCTTVTEELENLIGKIEYRKLLDEYSQQSLEAIEPLTILNSQEETWHM